MRSVPQWLFARSPSTRKQSAAAAQFDRRAMRKVVETFYEFTGKFDPRSNTNHVHNFVCFVDLFSYGVSTFTTGLRRTEAPSLFARTRTRGEFDERELEA